MQLTDLERLQLINQFEILKFTQDDSKFRSTVYGIEQYNKFQEILINKYETHYRDIFEFLHMSQEITSEEQEDVMLTFKMYNNIWKVIAQHPDEFTAEEQRKAVFHGYDGNMDHRYGYANFIAEYYRFHSLYQSKGLDGDNMYDAFNSHGTGNPDKYLAKFKEINETLGGWGVLTVNDVKGILNN